MQYNVYVTEIPDSSIAFSQRGISGKQKRYFHIIVLSHSLTHVFKKKKKTKETPTSNSSGDQRPGACDTVTTQLKFY